MAEPRRQEDQLYPDRAAIPSAREGVFFDNDQPAHDLSRPQLVNSPIAEDGRLEPAFTDRKTPSATYGRTSALEPVAATALFSTNDIEDLRARWIKAQTGFVDEPRSAVREADKLVAAVMDRLTEGFANERSALEKQWDRGDDVSTEELRLALQRYRTFFDRLLNI